MAKNFSRWAHMLIFGLSSFQLERTRCLHRHINRRKFLSPYERWNILGNRLRKAAEKLVGQNERR